MAARAAGMPITAPNRISRNKESGFKRVLRQARHGDHGGDAHDSQTLARSRRTRGSPRPTGRRLVPPPRTGTVGGAPPTTLMFMTISSGARPGSATAYLATSVRMDTRETAVCAHGGETVRHALLCGDP